MIKVIINIIFWALWGFYMAHIGHGASTKEYWVMLLIVIGIAVTGIIMQHD